MVYKLSSTMFPDTQGGGVPYIYKFNWKKE